MAQTLRSSPRTNLRMRWSSIGMPHGQAFKRCGPEYRFFRLSAKTGQGMEECLEFLSPQLSEQKTSVNSDKGDGTKNRHTVGRSRHPSAEALVNRSSRNPSAL